MKYYLNKWLCWFLYFTAVWPRLKYKFLYVFVLTIAIGLLPVATAQLMSGEEVTRRIKENEQKVREHEAKLAEFSITIAQNNLLIQQSIEDRRNIKLIQDHLVKSVNYAEGALAVIKWILFLFTPFISLLQLAQVYYGRKRDKLLDDLLSMQQRYFIKQQGTQIAKSFGDTNA